MLSRTLLTTHTAPADIRQQAGLDLVRNGTFDKADVTRIMQAIGADRHAMHVALAALNTGTTSKRRQLSQRRALAEDLTGELTRRLTAPSPEPGTAAWAADTDTDTVLTWLQTHAQTPTPAHVRAWTQALDSNADSGGRLSSGALAYTLTELEQLSTSRQIMLLGRSMTMPTASPLESKASGAR